MEKLLLNDFTITSEVNSWILMGSPAPIIFIFATYLLIILRIGPRYMKHRKPMELCTFTRIYNLAQVVLCLHLVNWSIRFGFKFDTLWQCMKDETDIKRLIEYKSVQWWFLMLRLAELIETIIFVLRKKQNQVSLLHIYHHISTATIIWTFTKYCTTLMDLHVAVINSCVHIIMYSYYLLSSFKRLSKMLTSVKPIITAIQVMQLIIILGQTITAILPNCHTTKLFYFQALNAIILIYFFAEFFVKTYIKQKQV